MANTIEFGPRCRISFVVFCTDRNLIRLQEVLTQNGRNFVAEKTDGYVHWKISVKCIVLQAAVLWNLVGHLTTEGK